MSDKCATPCSNLMKKIDLFWEDFANVTLNSALNGFSHNNNFAKIWLKCVISRRYWRPMNLSLIFYSLFFFFVPLPTKFCIPRGNPDDKHFQLFSHPQKTEFLTKVSEKIKVQINRNFKAFSFSQIFHYMKILCQANVESMKEGHLEY